MRTLSELPVKELTVGSHKSPDKGMCAMEAAAWLAGEPHNDHPVCVCPVLGAFVRVINDTCHRSIRASLRDRLPQLILAPVTSTDAITRGFIAVDYAVRVFAPNALRMAGYEQIAIRLERVPPIVSVQTAHAAYMALGAALDATHATDAERAAECAAGAAYATRATGAERAAECAASAAYAAANAANAARAMDAERAAECAAGAAYASRAAAYATRATGAERAAECAANTTMLKCLDDMIQVSL